MINAITVHAWVRHLQGGQVVVQHGREAKTRQSTRGVLAAQLGERRIDIGVLHGLERVLVVEGPGHQVTAEGPMLRVANADRQRVEARILALRGQWLEDMLHLCGKDVKRAIGVDGEDVKRAIR